MDNRTAKLNWEIVQRDNVIKRQGEKIDKQSKLVTILAGTLIVFSLLVIVYMTLELLK